MFYDTIRHVLTVSDEELTKMFSSVENYWAFWDNVASITHTPQLKNLITEARTEWAHHYE